MIFLKLPLTILGLAKLAFAPPPRRSEELNSQFILGTVMSRFMFVNIKNISDRNKN